MKFILHLVWLFLPAVLLAVEPAQRDEIKALLRDHKWAEAQALLQQIIAKEPASAEAHFFLGQSYLYNHDAEHALPALEKAVELDPTNSRYTRHLGDAYGLSAQKAGLFAKMGWASKCITAYNKAVELDPKDLNARWSVLEYCRQAPGFLGGGMDQAYAQAAAIKQIDVGAGRAAYVTLYVAEKKFPEAFAQFDDAIKADPNDYEAHLQLGKLADATGQELDLGLTSLRRCLTLTPPPKSAGHATVQWHLGNILAKQGAQTAARAAYEAAIALDPKFTPATEALAKLNAKS